MLELQRHIDEFRYRPNNGGYHESLSSFSNFIGKKDSFSQLMAISDSEIANQSRNFVVQLNENYLIVPVAS